MELGTAAVEFIHDGTIPSQAYVNIDASFRRDLPRFHRMAGLGVVKPGPVALVGGGPSLAAELGNLRSFNGPIISCGTVHDYLIVGGCPPTYHVDGEPDADDVMSRWYKHPDRGVCYLVASHCPATTFDALDGMNIWLWHCALRNEGDDCFRNEPAVPGGCANMLRAWPIATIMGYRDLHFFGFDCSFDNDSQHAYGYDWTLEEPCAATCKGERFLTSPQWLLQLQTFVQMVRQAKGRFKITIHGHSLAAKTMELINAAD